MSDDNWIRDTYRSIHLDFHTGDFVGEKIDRFDPERFVSTVVSANIEAITLFAKCHYGNSYYDTRCGRKHPGLKQDMLAELIPRLHKHDIRVVAYYSTCADLRAAMDHPDWAQVDPDGMLGYEGCYREVCLNSPYFDDLMLPQIREIAANYDIDGLWLDIVGVGPNKCFCAHCRRLYEERYGEPLTVESRHLDEFRLGTLQEAMESIRSAAHSCRKGLPITANGAGTVSDFGAAATLSRRRADGLVDFSAIEACPGYGNYYYVGFQARYARTLGRPYELINSRFVHLWGEWTAKPVEQLKYEAGVMLASGGRVTIGDQAYPDGSLDENLYRTLGEVFSYIRDREHCVRGTQAVADTAVLFSDGNTNNLKGADAVCCQLGLQHDLVDERGLESLHCYKLLIVPEIESLSAASRRHIADFVRQGGLLLLSGGGNVPEVSGVNLIGRSRSSLAYLPAEALPSPGIPLLVKSSPIELEVTSAEILMTWQLPLYGPDHEQFAIRYPSPGRISDKPAITFSRCGDGRVVYVGADIFAAFWQTNHWWLKDVIRYCLTKLDFRPLVRVNHTLWEESFLPPTPLQTFLRENDAGLLLHLIPFQPGPATGGGYPAIESIVPLRDVSVEVKTGYEPSAAILEPGATMMNFRCEHPYCHFTVDTLAEHLIVSLPR
ncbi:MAG: alpha-L-fucosidase [Armatimonadetes bacterium]|nr:alpha-L-fucosidase [Armatimonadota bacterium]